MLALQGGVLGVCVDAAAFAQFVLTLSIRVPSGSLPSRARHVPPHPFSFSLAISPTHSILPSLPPFLPLFSLPLFSLPSSSLSLSRSPFPSISLPLPLADGPGTPVVNSWRLMLMLGVVPDAIGLLLVASLLPSLSLPNSLLHPHSCTHTSVGPAVAHAHTYSLTPSLSLSISDSLPPSWSLSLVFLLPLQPLPSPCSFSYLFLSFLFSR